MKKMIKSIGGCAIYICYTWMCVAVGVVAEAWCRGQKDPYEGYPGYEEYQIYASDAGWESYEAYLKGHGLGSYYVGGKTGWKNSWDVDGDGKVASDGLDY